MKKRNRILMNQMKVLHPERMAGEDHHLKRPRKNKQKAAMPAYRDVRNPNGLLRLA
jgi:hypothetical protein